MRSADWACHKWCKRPEPPILQYDASGRLLKAWGEGMFNFPHGACIDPDGNLWLVQEVTTRHPGRIDPTETAFASAADLESALRRAEAAHPEHQKRTGRSHLFHRSSEDDNWPAWYASYVVAEQAGSDLPA